MLISMLSYADRQILNILVEPIKIEMKLSDSQLGALVGISFIVAYTALAIPFARLADRSNRVWLLSICAIVWSGLTAACSLATNLIQLMIARVGVGGAESAVNPCAYSLITDIVPRESRAKSLALLNMGVPLGTFVGMGVGGLAADHYGWRAALLIVGVPGLILSTIALLTLRDPRVRSAQKLTKRPGFLLDLKEILAKKSFVLTVLGVSFIILVNYGKQAFYGSFFLRNHADGLASLSAHFNESLDWSMGPVAIVGLIMGTVTGICGLVGTLVSGVVSDRLAKYDPTKYLIVPICSTLLQFPFLLAALLTKNVVLAFAMFAVPALLAGAYLAPVLALLMGLVRPEMRSTASAILMTFVTLFGLGVGPYSVGFLSDTFTAVLGDSGRGLRWAMVAMSSLAVVSASMFALAQRHVRDEFIS